MPELNAHEEYAYLLRWHSLGHALYRPVLSTEVKPGSVGFFNDHGRWKTLVKDIANAEFPITSFQGDLAIEKLTPIRQVMICSKKVQNYAAGLNAAIE